jgi:protein required for attachment to host cells
MEVRTMKIWIVVADEREALFYEVPAKRRSDEVPFSLFGSRERRSAEGDYRLVLKITNPQGRPDRELETDRPGRAFSSSTGQRHAIDGERSTERRHQEDFAKRIAEEIEKARYAGSFERVLLAAGPRMLGLIRGSLSAASRDAISAEIAKDLVRFEGDDLVERLPPETMPPRILRVLRGRRPRP